MTDSQARESPSSRLTRPGSTSAGNHYPILPLSPRGIPSVSARPGRRSHRQHVKRIPESAAHRHSCPCKERRGFLESARPSFDGYISSCVKKAFAFSEWPSSLCAMRVRVVTVDVQLTGKGLFRGSVDRVVLHIPRVSLTVVPSGCLLEAVPIRVANAQPLLG